jgi:hypothetical protein
MKKVCLSVILADQVRDDVKDTVYQTAGIAFFVREIPNQVGNDSFVIFIVILMHIMSKPNLDFESLLLRNILGSY